MPRVARLAVTIAVLTVGLMGLGGAVHATGSSLACPDWPLCHGQLMPAMVGGVALEHSHRLLASLVAVLTIWLVFITHRRRFEAPRVAQLAWVALGLVAVQAVLGGVTVLLELSTAASTLHLAVSMLFLTTLVLLASMAARAIPERGGGGLSVPRTLRSLVAIAWVALFVQIVLGGLVRHTGAAMACGRDPWLCLGDPWPAFPLARLQMIHRFGALVTAGVVLWVGRGVFRATRHRAVRRLAALGVGLVLAQIGLGVWSVSGALPVSAVTSHLVVAALLLVVLTHLAIRLGAVRATIAMTGDDPRRACAVPALDRP
ncbi:MAG: COX15/CtaA family protein [Myxococcota bacterium]